MIPGRRHRLIYRHRQQKHGEPEAAAVTEPVEPTVETEPAKEEMKRKLKTETGKALCKMRKAIVEAVFG
jgi:hypothetical protein